MIYDERVLRQLVVGQRPTLISYRGNNVGIHRLSTCESPSIQSRSVGYMLGILGMCLRYLCSCGLMMAMMFDVYLLVSSCVSVQLF